MQKLKNESHEAKRQLAMYQTRVRQAIDLIDGKNISRAKMLLKVDGEFLRRTLSMTTQMKGIGNSNADYDCKQIFSESVDAMKMLSFQVRQGQGQPSANIISHHSSISAEMDLLGFGSLQQQQHQATSSFNNDNLAMAGYAASGYRSNEIDEGTELNKLNA